MKVCIVFIGLLIVNITFISYQGDLNRYVRLQSFLKAVAEEAAAGAALYFDEEAYGQGFMILNREEGDKYIEDLVIRASGILKLKAGESLTYEMEIIDDSSGTPCPELSPSVTVTLRLAVKDLFRLSFLKREEVVRSARYELADY